MKKYALKNCIVLLSLVMFLATSVGNTFGYAWCFGDDGHSRIEQVTPNGCADKETTCMENDLPQRTLVIKTGDTHCSPCFDVLLEQNGAVVSKRSAKVFKIAIEAKPLAALLPAYVQQSIKHDPVAEIPRISQTILAHRTVVLLN